LVCRTKWWKIKGTGVRVNESSQLTALARQQEKFSREAKVYYKKITSTTLEKSCKLDSSTHKKRRPANLTACKTSGAGNEFAFARARNAVSRSLPGLFSTPGEFTGNCLVN